MTKRQRHLGLVSRKASGVWSGFPFDLRPLRSVLAAAEHTNLRAAANALNMDRSSVIRAVRKFEDRVGVAIFERGFFGVRLTNVGERLLDEIVPALLQIEHAVQLAAAAGRVESGSVRIGIVSTLAGGFLRKLVSEHEQAHPGIRLSIRDGGRKEHLRAIRARELDIAFLTVMDEAGGCDVSELWRERVYVAMSASHDFAKRAGLDWPDLRNEVLIVSRSLAGPDVHDYILRRIAGRRSCPTVEHCEAARDTIMHMVALGKGMTLVTEAWREISIPDLALVPLVAPEDIVSFSAVWSPENNNPSLQRFISFARGLASHKHCEIGNQ